jgi:plastocyanin
VRTAPRTLILVVAALVTFTACGGGDEVGDESLFEFDQDQAERLGGTSTTADPGDAVATTTTAAAQATTTTAPQVTTTLPPEQQEVSVEVKICDDDQGCANQYDPRIADVPVGGKVRFVNRGTKTYAVESTSGAFASGPIAPGKVWVYTATQPGTFDYTGGAGRPYAVGTVRVIA